MPRVIFNADDFGATAQINAAVRRAHREGVLTSASLMVTGAAWREAVAIAHAHRSLAVGLHVVLVSGTPALPADEIPHLVDSSGRFPDDPVRQGVRLAMSAAARRELAQELGAQFERFAATGLRLAHVDGHLHFHLHPVVLERLLPFAERLGAGGIRIPDDEIGIALAHDRRRLGARLAAALALRAACRRARRRLRGTALAVAERVYGLMQTGQMQERYVLDVLERSQARTFEIYFHPSTVDEETLGPNRADLATLLSPRVRETIARLGIVRTTYPQLQEDR